MLAFSAHAACHIHVHVAKAIMSSHPANSKLMYCPPVSHVLCWMFSGLVLICCQGEWYSIDDWKVVLVLLWSIILLPANVFDPDMSLPAPTAPVLCHTPVS